MDKDAIKEANKAALGIAKGFLLVLVTFAVVSIPTILGIYFFGMIGGILGSGFSILGFFAIMEWYRVYDIYRHMNGGL